MINGSPFYWFEDSGRLKLRISACNSVKACPSIAFRSAGEALFVITLLRCKLEFSGHSLRLQRQFCCQEIVFLFHRGLGTIDNIVNEKLSIGYRAIVAVEITGFLLVNKKKVVAALSSRQVGVLPYFYKPIRSQDDDSIIAPGIQSVGGKPVQAQIAGTAITGNRCIAEILERGVLRVVDVSGLRCYNLRGRRAGVK